MDAAHFVHQSYLGMVWSQERIYIPSPSGRSRFNVLGALDATSKEIVSICNDSYINSNSVCKLMSKLDDLETDIPITIILDNAKYQRCKIVIEYAAKLNIELLFLPTYSPNLNLIERLWRFVKKECLYSKYYEKFQDFKFAIKNCLNDRCNETIEKLNSLLTCSFQTFDNVKILSD